MRLPTTWPVRCGFRPVVTRATGPLSDLIGELSTRRDEFVARWARQSVRLHRTARKRLHNRVVGDIELTGNALELPGDDLILIAYTADPGCQAEDQLKLLTSWAASQNPAARPDPAQPGIRSTSSGRGPALVETSRGSARPWRARRPRARQSWPAARPHLPRSSPGLRRAAAFRSRALSCIAASSSSIQTFAVADLVGIARSP
jgi:hypothetical protein